MHVFLENVRRATELAVLPEGDPDTPATLMTFLLRLVENVYTYIGHQVRKQHEKHVDEQVLKELDAETIYIIVDWKMKLLEMAYRQAMCEFFGQRGIAWLGVMIYELKSAEELAAEATTNSATKTKYKTKFIDLTTDDGKEDGLSSAALLFCGLADYAAQSPHIKKFIIKTDGAGCFSGIDFCTLLAYAKLFCGLICIMMLRAEVGLGKTALDSHFARARLVLIRNVLAGRGQNDVHCAADCARVLALYGGVAGSTSGYVQLQRSSSCVEDKKQKSLRGFSSHLQRRFVYNDKDEIVQCELWDMSFRNRDKPDMVVPAKDLTCPTIVATGFIGENGRSTAPGPQIRMDTQERLVFHEALRERRQSKRTRRAARAAAALSELEERVQRCRLRRCAAQRLAASLFFFLRRAYRSMYRRVNTRIRTRHLKWIILTRKKLPRSARRGAVAPAAPM